MTPADYARARRLLMRRDPILGAAIKRIGPCGMAERQRNDHLTALVGAIVSQQLSTKAAATIFGRVRALVPDGEPLSAGAASTRLSDAALRGAGLSGQKVGYLRDLCARILDGRLQLDELEALPDEAVIERLVAVKGFGRWTAEMFLMFRLHRPDVLPVGDLGIVNAVQKALSAPQDARPRNACCRLARRGGRTGRSRAGICGRRCGRSYRSHRSGSRGRRARNPQRPLRPGGQITRLT